MEVEVELDVEAEAELERWSWSLRYFPGRYFDGNRHGFSDDGVCEAQD